MELLEVLKTDSSINLDSPEWQRVLRQLHIQMTIDVDKLDYYKCLPCKFALKSINGSTKISDRPGFFLSAKQGMLIICPSTTDLPITMFIDKKGIRVVQSEIKLLKSEIDVKTNEDMFVFKSNKKGCQDIEKEVNKVRLL
ncbi:MAG: hypothetical protein IKO27_07700 [Ruminococcus sp.]|nr:hypothetical protein [Ruminococcus sp.]